MPHDLDAAQPWPAVLREASVRQAPSAQASRAIEARDTAGVLCALNPRYERPEHLRPMIDALEASWLEPQRLTCHAPPQHGKTETVSAFVVATLARAPWTRIAYVTYAALMAQGKSARMREWARRCEISLRDDTQSKTEWSTIAGGGVFATGIGGPLTGRPVDLLLIDDPYANRQDAESRAYRQRVADWYGDVANTRVQPDGSIYVWHTRWVLDDLIGQIQSGAYGDGWRHVHLAALDAEGRALGPGRYPVDVLAEKRRASEQAWLSLYQGTPVARGGRVFGEPATCALADIPRVGRRAVGVDLAYSARSSADWSVAVSLVRDGDRVYVSHVERAQERVADFAARLRRVSAHGPMRWYCSGPEQGTSDLLAQLGVRIDARVTHADKHSRAQAAASACNAGQLVIPTDAPWSAPLIDELRRFTGLGDDHDDQVDALVAGFDQLAETITGRVATSQRSDLVDARRGASVTREQRGFY